MSLSTYMIVLAKTRFSLHTCLHKNRSKRLLMLLSMF